MTAPSPYEQLKDDLGYPALDATAECFATLAEQAIAEDWPPVVYLERVIAAQTAATRNRRLAARLCFARFPGRKTIEEFDFSFQPSIDKKTILDLATLRLVKEGRPILFLGQPGCGKSQIILIKTIVLVDFLLVSLGMNPTKHPTGRQRGRRSTAAVGALVLAGVLATAVETTTPASATTTSPLTVLTSSGRLPSGDLFLTQGPTAEIITKSGDVVWSNTAPAGDSYTDLRVQSYDGQPVVTFSVSGSSTGPLGPSGGDEGTDYILNDHFQEIATVEQGAGYNFDSHEFWITPQGTAWITATQTATADLTSIGGAADQTVTNGVAQEIDIRTGKVLLTWNSADHVSYADSQVALPTSTSQAWDWFHINDVSPGPNGTILVNSRHTWSTYDFDSRTGKVNWVLGGDASTFKQLAAPGQTLNSAGDLFAWEHDPQYIGANRYWIFDDESNGSVSDLPYSRAVEVQIDPVRKTATIIASRNQPEGLTAGATGGVQPLPNGDLLVGWGTLPYVSIYNQAGTLIYNAEYTSGVSTYRAYLFNWPPTIGWHTR